MNINELLSEAVQCNASDLHVTVGAQPNIRIHGELMPLDLAPITESECRQLVEPLLKVQPDLSKRFSRQGEVNFAYTIDGQYRFRVNAFRQQNKVALAIRILPSRIRSLDELGHPDVLKKLARLRKGLVLVTGAAGSGKSTTLAAMIDLINTERRCHILTLEDPIEYLHPHKKAVVNQREIQYDTQTFQTGLASAMRSDPNVILIGEIRNNETMATAITAAETGHLVFATLHTNDAPQTVNRIIDVFPVDQQQQIRIQLAMCLQGIVSQQLIINKEKSGVAIAFEILRMTPAIQTIIREGRIHQVRSEIKSGKLLDMIDMDTSLEHLYNRDLISVEEAISRAHDEQAMDGKLKQKSDLLSNRKRVL